MTAVGAGDAYYDPYDLEINQDPYPALARLRDQSPVYHNERFGFYALSRFDDVERGLKANARFVSGRGGILELIQAGIEMPPGNVIFEDPPTHTIHRRLLSRMFTPRKVAALEPQIREFCARSLDPLVGRREFDVIEDLAAFVPMRVIGMLLGIPEHDQEAIRDRSDSDLRTEDGGPMKVGKTFATGDMFADYVDWRVDHPSDDIMTDLLNVEFEDETGRVRRLHRNELLTYLHVVAGAGNETTARLIGWTVKVLADHPDQRRELADDPALIPNAIEEVLRFETTSPHVGRCAAVDVELHGEVIPAGSPVLMLIAAANRDDRHFVEPDRFDIHREGGARLTFGHGPHYCLGAALARLEGRVVLEELLTRFPEWEIDKESARLAPTSTVRGWEKLPVTIP